MNRFRAALIALTLAAYACSQLGDISGSVPNKPIPREPTNTRPPLLATSTQTITPTWTPTASLVPTYTFTPSPTITLTPTIDAISTPTANPTRIVYRPGQETIVTFKDVQIERSECNIFPASNPYVCFKNETGSDFWYIHLDRNPVNYQLIKNLSQNEIRRLAEIGITGKDSLTDTQKANIETIISNVARQYKLKFGTEDQTENILYDWMIASAVTADFLEWYKQPQLISSHLSNLYLLTKVNGSIDGTILSSFCMQQQSYSGQGCQFKGKKLVLNNAFSPYITAEEEIHATGPRYDNIKGMNFDFTYNNTPGYIEITSVKGFGFYGIFHPYDLSKKTVELEGLVYPEEAQTNVTFRFWLEERGWMGDAFGLYRDNVPGSDELYQQFVEAALMPNDPAYVTARSKGKLDQELVMLYPEGNAMTQLFGKKGIMPRLKEVKK